MKNTYLILLLFVAFSCCKKDDDDPINPIDQLPPATQTGANNAGCLVNGEAFLPGFGQTPLPLSCNYTGDMDFSLFISNRVNDISHIIYIYIYIGNTDIQVGQTYQLGENLNGDSLFGEYIINVESSPSPNYYSTTAIITGEVTITHHDFDNAFLSGTFWFDAINSNGEKVEVREGRFDAEY